MEVTNSQKMSYPGPKSKKIINICKELEGTGLKTFESDIPSLVLETANGVWLKDPDGNKYLDLYAGYAAANIGHSHPRVVEAISRQADRLIHCPSAYCSDVRAQLVQRLSKIALPGMSKILLGLTGSQANEAAYNLVKSATGKNEIICFHGGYFGRSNTTVSLNGKTRTRVTLGLEPKAHFIPYPYCYRCSLGGCENPDQCKVIDFVEEILTNPASGVGDVAAVFMEPMLGNGGPVIPPEGFIARLNQTCQKHSMLLVLDEIQTGFGRTGLMWAAEHDSIVPDLMTIGKGIGGGMPVSALWGRKDLMNVWEPDIYTTTFLTNAVNHAAAVAAIDIMIEERLWENAYMQGEYLINTLRSKLEHHQKVGEIRGKGLLIGIEIVKNKENKTPAPDITKLAKEKGKALGIFLGSSGYYGNVIKLTPPLVIERDEVDYAIDRIIKIFGEI